ncbi:Acg family FMN-binding oxidoreductase [Nocardia sp. XZ_19_385]|uniref:Acg family FMN-binding oxidoreductase n=1 Tax=Nocardia sp. XZ_19_385 TaxID=2769488 RepID=UPI00188FFA5E|nr:nitroreductase family protein [Nocardia sp. XZ_19_385]
MYCVYPGFETIRAAVGLAQRAPSVHNSQPWRWQLMNDHLHLYADTSRHLTATDPQQRALTLSCGAVLHHARVALCALGWSSEVEYVPNPDVPEHLAVLHLAPHRPSATDIHMAAAMAHRRSDRRRYGWGQVPETYVKAAMQHATRFGAAVTTVTRDDHPALSKLMRRAAEHHENDALYQIELAAWSGRRGTREGVPARNATAIHAEDELPGRAFMDPVLIDPKPTPDAATWLMISTDRDDRLAQLRAGESLSALLLAATDLGLATCIQTEPLGLPELREDIRFSLCEGAHPQVMVRTGLVTHAGPLPETPRRLSDDVLAHSLV